MLAELYALPLGILLLVPLWRIHRRAGQNPALALFVLIPYVGVGINALILAFGDWPRAGHWRGRRHAAWK